MSYCCTFSFSLCHIDMYVMNDKQRVGSYQVLMTVFKQTFIFMLSILYMNSNLNAVYSEYENTKLLKRRNKNLELHQKASLREIRTQTSTLIQNSAIHNNLVGQSVFFFRTVVNVSMPCRRCVFLVQPYVGLLDFE